ncbi:MAG: hypothetical protein Q9191_005511 [Dirinaria sp. TL-2023a]
MSRGGVVSFHHDCRYTSRAWKPHENLSVKTIPHLAAMGSYSPSFERPNFRLVLDQSAAEAESIRSLPDLVLFNALYNPQAIFCAQIQQSKIPQNDFEIVEVTFLELAHAVERCCQWILSNIGGVYPAKVFEDGEVQKGPPLALFLESDLTLFIYIAALLTLNIPVGIICSPFAALPVVFLTNA